MLCWFLFPWLQNSILWWPGPHSVTIPGPTQSSIATILERTTEWQGLLVQAQKREKSIKLHFHDTQVKSRCYNVQTQINSNILISKIKNFRSLMSNIFFRFFLQKIFHLFSINVFNDICFYGWWVRDWKRGGTRPLVVSTQY